MDGRRISKSNNKYHCSVTIHFKFITKCDSLFYFKMRWSFITKYDSFFITKCYKCYNYKVRQIYYKVRENTRIISYSWISICILIKIFSRNVPIYLNSLLVRTSEIHNRATRRSNINLVCPSINKKQKEFVLSLLGL